jgi:anti-sigma factor RsiW
MSEQVSGDEIQAYVDGRLGTDGRSRVQGYLAQRPYLAAQVMADLRGREDLRAALCLSETPRPDSVVLAGRLQRRLTARRYMLDVSRGIAALMLVALGWFLHLQVAAIEADYHPSPALLRVLLQAGEALVEAELGLGGILVERLARPG